MPATGNGKAARRLSREQQQQQTRERLLRSAAAILATEGSEGVSVEEVAEAAGYSKGAFYSNFGSKEDLFLEMLDQHFGQRLAEIERAASAWLPPEDRVRQAAADFIQAISSNVEGQRILFEFTVYATRNDRFRAELVERYRVLRERLAAVIDDHLGPSAGSDARLSADEAALMLVAVGMGVARAKLLEPDSISEELYGSMLTVFFRGLAGLPDDEQTAARGSVGTGSARGRG